jgi:hypothetical protein
MRASRTYTVTYSCEDFTNCRFDLDLIGGSPANGSCRSSTKRGLHNLEGRQSFVVLPSLPSAGFIPIPQDGGNASGGR